ncbi:HAD family hydrolase [Arcticibacter sp.]|uniref:HAD family hydrolase n=1 Tax=Arcticibacter sp. TaxID=1872630 RepID=UPI003890CEF4
MAETESNKLKLAELTELSKGDYEAFLYDCDGTLADNMAAHKESYAQVALGGGIEIDPAIIDEFAGLPIPVVVEKINERYGATFDPQTFEMEKYAIFYNNYIEHTKPVQFVVDHLLAHVGKVKIAVVSGGSREAILKTLRVLGIESEVDVLVCAGETPRGKPYPDPFLKAAELLGVKPDTCLVFEDGQAGVEAAEMAGMDWIRIDKLNP